MHLRYLGDALDHWKGSLFERLQGAGLLRDFKVDAMATDPDDWQAADVVLYAHLLRVEENQIIGHRRSLLADRPGYFQEITHPGDVFLDPDTGIATRRPRLASQYIFPVEIRDLLGQQPNRVVSVYQHIRARRTRDRLNEVLDALKLQERAFSCCSYESGTVAMLFFSRNAGRVDSIYQHFHPLLGRHADRRIYRWRHLQKE